MNMDHISLEFTAFKYIVCFIIVHAYYYYYIPMTIMDYNHSTQEHIKVYLMSTMVSTLLYITKANICIILSLFLA